MSVTYISQTSVFGSRTDEEVHLRRPLARDRTFRCFLQFVPLTILEYPVSLTFREACVTPVVYPRALNRRWAIRANGLRARQIRSTAIRPCLFIRVFPLVDFPLAPTASGGEAFDFDYRGGARSGSNRPRRSFLFFTSAQVKLRIRREHVARVLRYFVTAPLILTFVTCRRSRQVFPHPGGETRFTRRRESDD